MLSSTGRQCNLVDNYCDGVQKLCKTLETKNSGFVFASVLSIQMN